MQNENHAQTGFTCNLRRYRQMAGLTQDELANLVHVRRETIVRLEAARYNPSLKLAMDLSREVRTPIEELFVFE
ncbi:MAG: helix-turn-helix transcriptional regulator [Anaerolineaceae bacterium]